MAITRLQEDLLLEFREEKRMVQEQIDDFDPLSVSLRRSAAARLAGKGLILLGELSCWAGFFGAIAAGVFLKKLIPFYLMFQLSVPRHEDYLGPQNVQMLQWGVYGLIGLCGLLFFFLARALARIRQKNDILAMTGGRIKRLIGQQLQRRAAIEAIEQRHFGEMPVVAVGVNEVPNPGYDGYENILQKPVV